MFFDLRPPSGTLRVEIADPLDVRVCKLEDIEDDGELLPLAREVVVGEEGDLDGVLVLRRGWPGSLSAVERLMADSLMGRTCQA